MQGENPLPLPPSQTDTDDPPCITGAVPPPGREVDVIDEADEIDVPRIPGRGAGLRSALGVRQGNADLRAGASMTSMASVTSKPRASLLPIALRQLLAELRDGARFNDVTAKFLC